MMKPQKYVYPKFSNEDSDLASKVWFPKNSTPGKSYKNYARRQDRGINVQAHRIVAARIAGRALSPSEIVDHINGDHLDNRRQNLRVVDHAGNSQNRKKCKARSGAIGVVKKGQKWKALIVVKGRTIYLGMFPSIKLAAQAYDEAAEANGYLTRSLTCK